MIIKLRSFLLSVWLNTARSYDHLRRRITGAPRAATSQITPALFVGGQFDRRGIGDLKAWGITGVISMRIKKPNKFYEQDWLDVLHLPTVDQTAPTMEHLVSGIGFIKEHVNEGGKVYIHCRAGEGRGPTMAVAYLISTGLTLEDSLTQIAKVRKFIRPTKHQLKQLKKLEATFT